MIGPAPTRSSVWGTWVTPLRRSWGQVWVHDLRGDLRFETDQFAGLGLDDGCSDSRVFKILNNRCSFDELVGANPAEAPAHLAVGLEIAVVLAIQTLVPDAQQRGADPSTGGLGGSSTRA